MLIIYFLDVVRKVFCWEGVDVGYVFKVGYFFRWRIKEWGLYGVYRVVGVYVIYVKLYLIVKKGEGFFGVYLVTEEEIDV